MSTYSGPNKWEPVEDETLRPWTLDPVLDDRFRDESFELEDCLVMTSPNKWAGGLGVSPLDRVPRDGWQFRSHKKSTMEEFEDSLRKTLGISSFVEGGLTGVPYFFAGTSLPSVDEGLHQNGNGEFDADCEDCDDSINSGEQLDGEDSLGDLTNSSLLLFPDGSAGSLSLDRPSTTASNRPMTRKEVLRSLRTVPIAMKASEKKALSSVKYENRNGLHTLQISRRKYPKIKKVGTLVCYSFLLFTLRTYIIVIAAMQSNC
jgi:hypothetical protein